jgi:hypothetical protein
MKNNSYLRTNVYRLTRAFRYLHWHKTALAYVLQRQCLVLNAAVEGLAPGCSFDTSKKMEGKVKFNRKKRGAHPGFCFFSAAATLQIRREGHIFIFV